jgi:hypothetical protein
VARKGLPAMVAAAVAVAGACGPAAPAFGAGGRAGLLPAATLSIQVTSLADAGPGTLRAAIADADSSPPGTSTVIGFAVSGIITLASRLPAVSRQVTVDGTSAPGYTSGGPPVVEVNCADHGGLVFAAGSRGSELLGLAVDNASGAGVTLDAGGITVNANYIGLDLRGQAFGNRGDGVYAGLHSPGNFIGLNPSGASGAVANVISGNRGSGLVLAGSSGNTVVSNRIGTGPGGMGAIGNGRNGIWITAGAHGNEIGGTAFVDSATGQANNPTGDKGQIPPTFVVPPLGNLISGNGRNGVLIDSVSEHNTLNGNFVGTTANGDAAVGNHWNGVWIDRAGENSLTGCTFVNNPFVYYNVLAGNHLNGLRVSDSRNVTVQGNFFGIGANNTTTVANWRDGVRVDRSSANTQVGGVIPLGNVSSGNRRNGIEVAGKVSGFTTFNTFGGLLAFKGAAPNGHDGVLITATGGGNLVRTNVFSGNRGNGIELAGNAAGVTVDPDIAGLDTNGSASLPNGGDGLRIGGNAHGNVVGGTLRSVIPQNTFSGNGGYGIVITGTAHGNRVFTTFLGTEILGVSALGNHKGGVLVGGRAYRNTIGSAHPLPTNVISGNTGNGVTLTSGTHGNLITHNRIGIDRFGQCLRNTGRGLVNNGHGNRTSFNRYRCTTSSTHQHRPA